MSVPFVDMGASVADWLAGSLDATGSALVRDLGVSNFLAIATVARGERAAGRLIVSTGIADAIVELVRAAGASCHRADFHCIERLDAVTGTHHRASFVAGQPKDSDVVLYFGLKPAYAEAAETAEIVGDHLMTARLFGYPECCAAAFGRSTLEHPDKLPGTITRIGPYPRSMNPLSFYVYGAPTLLFHFPCSPDCTPSAQLLESRRAFLGSLIGRPDLLTELGDGIAVYGPEVGIGLITRFSDLGDDGFEIHEVTTRDRRTRSLFEGRAPSRIRLVEAHEFEIGSELFSGELTFAARFQ